MSVGDPAETARRAAIDCVVCRQPFIYERHRYDGRPVKAWGGMMVCNMCRRVNHDGIVASTRPHLIPMLRAAGFEVVPDAAGLIRIPE